MKRKVEDVGEVTSGRGKWERNVEEKSGVGRSGRKWAGW